MSARRIFAAQERGLGMKSKLLWLIIAVTLIAGCALWYVSTRNPSEIDPHAAEEIERAKRRY